MTARLHVERRDREAPAVILILDLHRRWTENSLEVTGRLFRLPQTETRDRGTDFTWSSSCVWATVFLRGVSPRTMRKKLPCCDMMINARREAALTKIKQLSFSVIRIFGNLGGEAGDF